MKAMTIGISPEYNYPGRFEKWRENNTYYASNHGGSLITRAIMKEFDADYIDDFSDLPALSNKYDTCIMAFATHVHQKRDVSYYVDILEKMQIRTIVLSIGVQDYTLEKASSLKVHPSVERLLRIAAEGSDWIGVRGPYTADILVRNGFKNVVPIGCPTMYWNLRREFDLPDRPASIQKSCFAITSQLSLRILTWCATVPCWHRTTKMKQFLHLI